jgi:CheY-like chemotaxis protein
LLVLVAEDNTINQRVIKRLLEKISKNHFIIVLMDKDIKSVDIVEDGVGAVEACAKKKYDLVLMDIMVTKCYGKY